MTKTRLKLAIWLTFSLLLAGTALVGIAGLANLVAYFQKGADPAAALNLIPNRPPDWPVAVTWLPDEADTGRDMEPVTRTRIEDAYVRAWLQRTLSYQKGENFGLGSYFSGPALAALEADLVRGAAAGRQIEQVALGHRLQLHFYSADGSIVALTDYGANLVHRIGGSGDTPALLTEETVPYQIIMIQIDGTWKVRQWVRREDILPPEDVRPAAKPTPDGLVEAAGSRLAVGGRPFIIRGVNYYPQESPWLEFWPNYDGALIDRDLAHMRALGFNTVRIFVPFEQFGGADVDPVMIARLRDFLNVAGRRELQVIVTLFDFRGDYSLVTWPAADRHLETLLTTFNRHPAILAWDLKNEPDLDFDSQGEDLVTGWLAHAADLARRTDPHHLVTIGWSSPAAAAALVDRVDFVSFHYYEPAGDLPGRLAALRRKIGPEKPVALTEFGLPTWNSFFFPNGHTPAEQAVYLSQVLAAVEIGELAGSVVWTLYDFSEVPPIVAGSWPWQTGPQRHLGLIDLAGNPKPAAALFAPEAGRSTLPSLPGWRRFVKPFWLALEAMVGLAILAVTAGLPRRHRVLAAARSLARRFRIL